MAWPHPGEPREAAGEHGPGEAQVLLGLAHVARHDQPVLGVGEQAEQRLAGLLVAQVEVGEGPELHAGGEKRRGAVS